MKKYKIRNLLYLLIGIVVLSTFKVNALLPLSGKTIVIDPGHGLEYYLSTNGASVILTRNGNYDLSSPNIYNRKRSDFDNRIKIINNNNADMYLSIHLNYLSDASYYGPQVFYNRKKDNNKLLAETIQNYLNTKTNTKREIKNIPERTYMYNKLKPTGVLIECGFLSNYKEKQKLKSDNYQKKIAQYITEAIIKFY